MGQFALTVIALAFITAMFLAWYFSFQARRDERMFLLEKGVDPADLPDTGIINFRFRFPWRKVGIVLIAGTLGLLAGGIVTEIRNSVHGIEPLFGMLIFGGIGLIIAHYVGKTDDES